MLTLRIHVCLVALASLCAAQTRLDLRYQTKFVDFGNAVTTRPFKTGTSLPSQCSVGEAYFKTDAPAGLNIYGCVAPNAWAPQTGASDFSQPAGTVSTGQMPASGVTAGTYGSGTQIPQITVDATGRITAASQVAASGGGSSYTAGAGISITGSVNGPVISVDAAVVPAMLTATQNLSFAGAANAACAADVTMTLLGAAEGDAIAPGWPSLPAGVFGTMWVSAENTVSVRLCNLSGGAVGAFQANLKAVILRYF